MAALGVEVVRVRGAVDVEGLANRQVRLRLESGLLRLSDVGLRWLLPPGTPVRIERIRGGRLFASAQHRLGFFDVTAMIEVRPVVSSRGRIRLEPVSFTAAGVSLGAGTLRMLLGAIRDRLNKPGLYLTGENVLEIDLAEILWKVAGVEMPPLKAVRAGDGVAELEF